MFYKHVWFNGGDWPDRQLAPMKTRAEQAFAAMDPIPGFSWAHSAVFHYSDEPPWNGWYDVDIWRTFGTVQHSALLPALDWDLYALSVRPPEWEPELAEWFDHQYNPFDDFALVPTEGLYTKVASGSVTDGEISVPIGKDEVPAWAEDLGVGWAAQEGHRIASLAFILKWQFTHA